MAHNIITLEKGLSRKPAIIGFSFTTLFFGWFVPLFRSDIKWFAIMLIASIVSLGLSWFVFPFIYNKLYLNLLLEEGYKPASKEEELALKQFEQLEAQKKSQNSWGCCDNKNGCSWRHDRSQG